jgi:hypothetical protein
MLLFGNAFFHPNDYLTVQTGDGAKNYYTYQYSIASDQAINFQGFNYPYGECFFFLDSHPILSILFHGLNRIFPGFDEYTIGILNFLLMFNLVITWMLLYLILKRKIAVEWYALLVSLGIMMLQPQIFRLLGHLSLSFSMALPLTWYLLIRINEGNRRNIFWNIALIVSNLYWMFIHTYLGASTIAFSLLYLLSYTLMHRKQSHWYHWLSFIWLAVLPGIIAMCTVNTLDNHIGRSMDRWGFGLFDADFHTVFVPIMGYWHDIIIHIIPTFTEQNWEGWAYIGLVGIVATIIAIVYPISWLILLLIRSIRHKPIVETPAQSIYQYFIPALFSGSVLLLYAMITNKDNHSMLWLADHIDLVKSFRSTGRFAWSFYYVITVFGASFFYVWIQKKWGRRKVLSTLLLLIIPLSLILEAVPYFKTIHASAFKIDNRFRQIHLPDDMKQALLSVNASDYQAVFPIPYYFKTSGTYGINQHIDEEAVVGSQLLAYHTRLPLTASYMDMIAIPEEKKQIQLLNYPYYDKEIEADFPNKKPFLVYYYKDAPLAEWDNYYLSKSTLIQDCGAFELRSLSFENMFEKDEKQIEEWTRLANLQEAGQDTFSLHQQGVMYRTFDENHQQTTKFGYGSWSVSKEGIHTIWSIEPNLLCADTAYEFSFWSYNCSSKYGRDKDMTDKWVMRVNEVSAETKTELGVVNANSTPVIVGCWSLCRLIFTPNDIRNRIEIEFDGTPKKDTLYFDEFLLRPVNKTVIAWKTTPDSQNRILYVNNHFINVSASVR